VAAKVTQHNKRQQIMTPVEKDNRIRELEDTIVHYKARDDQLTDILNRIIEVVDELEDVN
jgi:hypothetical protein